MSVNPVLSSGLTGMNRSLQELHRNADDIANSIVRSDGNRQALEQANVDTAVTPEANTGGQGSLMPTDESPRLAEALVEQRVLEAQFKASASVVETGVEMIDTILEMS
jgi:flagellar hook protein FlgE